MTLQQCIRGFFALLFFAAMTNLLVGCGNNTPQENASGDALTEEEKEGAVAVGEENVPPLEEGKALYISYCSLCHGEHGEGVMTEHLEAVPPDLTKIAARNGGEFPTDRIAAIVAGKEDVAAHSEMPDWWETFKESEKAATETELQEKINHLVLYLKNIQEKEGG